MRLLSKLSMTCIFLLGLTTGVYGQEGRSMRDFEFIRSSSPWLTSRNAAGLSTMPVKRAAVAEGTFTKDNGGLIGNACSDDSFKAGVQTESYMKISDRMAFHGKLSYTYDRGRNMGGSILMDPDYNPINFYESVDTTRGVKNKELYHLTGRLAYTFKDSRWSLGAGIDYESGDQAKLKDPRFLNVWMDLSASIGTRFAASDAFSAGLSFEYRRTLESVLGNIYGVSGKQYYNFVDYGGFYGTRDLFDSSFGIIATETRPMFNSFIGGSLQIEAGRKTKVFNQLTYLMRGGYFGNRSSSKIIYTEHAGNIIEYNGVLLAGSSRNLHRVGLDVRFENLINNENVYRLNTELGENTVVEYISQNEVLDRTDISAAMSYTGYLGVENFRPRWEYGATATFESRQSLTTIYPFYRSSGHNVISAEIFGKRNFLSGKNLFTADAGAGFLAGSGVAKDDGAYASTSSDAPRSFDMYLYRDFEYRTASRISASLSLRYTRLFSDRIAGYIQLSDKYISLLESPQYLNNGHRNSLVLTIGCTF